MSNYLFFHKITSWSLKYVIVYMISKIIPWHVWHGSGAELQQLQPF
jgi:hypothetical protein